MARDLEVSLSELAHKLQRPFSLPSGKGLFHFSLQRTDEEGTGERSGVSQEVTHFPPLSCDVNEGEKGGKVCSDGVLA